MELAQYSEAATTTPLGSVTIEPDIGVPPICISSLFTILTHLGLGRAMSIGAWVSNARTRGRSTESK
jgi:hypothetical protein